MAARTRDLWEVNKYLWICLFFVGLFIPVASARGWVVASPAAAYGLYAVALANGAVRTYLGWRRGGRTGPWGWLLSGIDAAVISGAVYVSRGLDSELWLLYFVLVLSDSLFATALEAAALMGFAAAGYVAATWNYRVLPDYPLTIVTRMFFLALAMAFTRRLSGDRMRRAHELAALQEQVAASEERARIAREIHDSLGHALVASILRLELCRRLLRRSPDEAESILSEEVPALRAAWNEGRDLAFHLRPWERGEGDMMQALRRNIGRFSERTGLAVDLRSEGDLPLTAEGEVALTRIVQEALTNVAKHAEAEHVAVDVALCGREVRCTIQDDGVGFDAEARADSFGLTAMRERAEKAGGSFRIESRPGSGTTITAVLPGG